MDFLQRMTGLLGIVLILGFAYFISNNRARINWRLVASGLGLQLFFALFVLKTSFGRAIFQGLGSAITFVLGFAQIGGQFVFGPLCKPDLMTKAFGADNSVLFVINVCITVIFVAVLVAMAYYWGLMQRIVSILARGVRFVMPVSGAEALSNVATAFVGQVEAQIMIKPYLVGMTRSELLASMTGSMACIAGSLMAIYIDLFHVPAEYLLAASIMAAPGALVISKMVYPETEVSETTGTVKLAVKAEYTNLIDAIAQGATEGLKIALNVIAVLIGLLSLVALVDACLKGFGGALADHAGLVPGLVGFDLHELSLNSIFGGVFRYIAFTMGVPWEDTFRAGTLMGEKLVLNEFVAYRDMSVDLAHNTLHPKTIAILSFALCGFANLGSVAMQIGGIGELAPTRRADLSQLGMKALLCGTLTSYLSACMAGILF